MSAEPLSLACQLEDLKQLDNKPYLKFQTHLYDYDIEHLPDNLYRLKAKLARLQKTDKRHNKGVVISQCRLAKLLGKSRETINRLLNSILTVFPFLLSLFLSRSVYHLSIAIITPGNTQPHTANAMLLIEMIDWAKYPSQALKTLTNKVSKFFILPNILQAERIPRNIMAR